MTFVFENCADSVSYEGRQPPSSCVLEITASANGVEFYTIGSPIIKSEEDYEQLTRVLGWAWRQHLSMKTSGIALNQEELERELIS